MGKVYRTVIEYESDLLLNMRDIVENDLMQEARNSIRAAANTHVYNYIPRFTSRRDSFNDNKLTSDASLEPSMTEYSSSSESRYELTIRAVAPWQHLSPHARYHGGPNPSEDLSDVVENSTMYHAPRRPFMTFAEQDAQRRFENFIFTEMISRGF